VQAQAEQARAAYAATQELLRNSNVRAPRHGTVYSLPVRSGQFVNAGELLIQVADLRNLQVRAFVDEPDVGRLGVGERVLVTWDAVPGRTLPSPCEARAMWPRSLSCSTTLMGCCCPT
jgi:multidrug resistance efflux pump